jgi:DNA-binding NtrC family response regulator
MKELLASYQEPCAADVGSAQGSIFEGHEHTQFRGVSPALEHLLRKTGDTQSWNDTLAEIERFFIDFAMRRASGRVSMALKLPRMPKRTFYNKVKKLGIDVQGYSRPKPSR